MSITPDDLASQQWDALVALFIANLNVGNDGVPGNGSNTSGLLQSAYYVHESMDLWSNDLPSIGVQLVQVDPGAQPYASNQNMVESLFHILIATKANKNQTTGVIVLDDAMRQLRTLIDDGNGNGVVPLLSSRANFTLGGLALRSRVGKTKLNWQMPDDTDVDARAFAVIEYRCWQIVSYLA